MSKRASNNDENEKPQKKILKVEKLNESMLSSKDDQLLMSQQKQTSIDTPTTSEQLSILKSENLTESVLPLKADQQSMSSEKQISSDTPTTSVSVSHDRYTFDYWGNSNNKVTNTQEIHHLKIQNLEIGKLENIPVLVRITYKSEVKDTKFGKVVSFLAMDETGEIGIVCFGKCGLDLHKKWENNRIYSIQNFTVHEENVNYPSGSNNSLQIKTNPNFSFEFINDDKILPPISFSFKSIEEIRSLKNNTRVDLLGILLKDYGLETNANNVSLRDLYITDDKKGTIIATLWGAQAEKFKSSPQTVIAIRKGNLTEFQDRKKINCTGGTLVWQNPVIPQTSPILKWFHECNSKKDL